MDACFLFPGTQQADQPGSSMKPSSRFVRDQHQQLWLCPLTPLVPAPHIGPTLQPHPSTPTGQHAQGSFLDHPPPILQDRCCLSICHLVTQPLLFAYFDKTLEALVGLELPRQLRVTSNSSPSVSHTKCCHYRPELPHPARFAFI